MPLAPLPRLAVFVALAGMMALADAGRQTNKPKAIFPAPAVAKDEIRAALAKAAKEHKRVILDFGGNWCGDCKVLDRYFHEEPNASLLRASFILVDVNIGHFDQNKAIAKAYEVPLEKGVPALVVLDENGRTLFSQKKGEFELMRELQPSALTEFLNRWKG